MMTQMIDMTQRFHNRPLMISEEMVEHLRRQTLESVKIEDQSVSAAAMWTAAYSGERKPYRMEGNVAFIPVNGTLYHKVDWAGYSYTGYGWLNKMMEFAKDDPEVKGVVMDFATGGGEVDGAFESAARVRELAEVKPVLGLVNNHAYSAGYLLLAATTKIAIPATGGVGSIGVVTGHMDVSEAMSEAGYKLTFIFKGKHKVDGNAYQPLPKDVQKRIDAKLDVPYNLFVDTVAKYRAMDSQVIRDTEAMTYTAEEALTLGLVDSVASPDEAIAAFVAELNGKQWGTSMTVEATTQQTTTNADNAGNNAVVDLKSVNAAREEGTKAGAAAERTRIMGILGCEEAKGRSEMAQVLCEQGLSVEQAKAILASAPAVQTTASTTTAQPNHFENAMNTTANPEVTASTTDAAAQKSPAQKALAALTLASGENFDTK
jgi:signal peptide peptidase SppA